MLTVCAFQATAPMQIRGGVVYGDHGAANHPLAPDGKRNWSFGLFDCFGRCGLCTCGTG